MAPRYPVFLDLAGRPCLVAGGGAVATRKAGGLLDCGARVTVVSPRLSSTIAAWRDEGRLTAEERPFAPRDVAGMLLVFAATDDAEVNALVAAEAKRAGAWVNVADAPDSGDFYNPALWRKENVTLAVATEGASPALAAALRDLAAAALPPGTGLLAARLAKLRKSPAGTASKETWQNLLKSGILDDLARGDRAAWERKIEDCLGEGALARGEAGTREKP